MGHISYPRTTGNHLDLKRALYATELAAELLAQYERHWLDCSDIVQLLDVIHLLSIGQLPVLVRVKLIASLRRLQAALATRQQTALRNAHQKDMAESISRFHQTVVKLCIGDQEANTRLASLDNCEPFTYTPLPALQSAVKVYAGPDSLIVVEDTEGHAGERNIGNRVQPILDLLNGVEEAIQTRIVDAAANYRIVFVESDLLIRGTTNTCTGSVQRAYDQLRQFRQRAGLRPYAPDSGGSLAMVEVQGHRYYGVNSQITSASQTATRELRQTWLLRVRWVPPKTKIPKHLGHAQSLTHAESHALIRAYERNQGRLPSTLTLYVDRKTCNMCRGELPALLATLQVDELKIYSGGNTTPIIIKACVQPEEKSEKNRE